VTAVYVALGAAAGAATRYLVAHALDRGLPLGTLLVNLAGSFLFGVASGLVLSGHEAALLGAGFCGAFTTYSAFTVQAATVSRERGRAPAAAYALGTVLLGLAACSAGFWLAA